MLGQGDGRSDVREVGQSLREVSQHLAVFVSRDMTGTRDVRRATTTRKRTVDPTNTSLEPENRGEVKVVQLATCIPGPLEESHRHPPLGSPLVSPLRATGTSL